ncbi:MAG: hypothetical protein LBC39_00845 [Methanobrevibacter sp.]|jgi:hypothetical protein|nr:hypothetical protein [Candidatus Methanovirga aequatorialis]
MKRILSLVIISLMLLGSIGAICGADITMRGDSRACRTWYVADKTNSSLTQGSSVSYYSGGGETKISHYLTDASKFHTIEVSVNEHITIEHPQMSWTITCWDGSDFELNEWMQWRWFKRYDNGLNLYYQGVWYYGTGGTV